MNIETASDDDHDERLNGRPAKKAAAENAASFSAESSRSIGDYGMLDITLYRNDRSEWWLTLVVCFGDPSDEDFDWEEQTTPPRVIAFTADAPSDAQPLDVGDALLHAYEEAGGYTGDFGEWR